MSQEALKYSLQALAQPAAFQLRLLEVWLDFPSELPERFLQAHRHVLAGRTPLTRAQADAVEALYSEFNSFSGPSNAEHWLDEALNTSAHWETVRQLARVCLQTFGWPVDEPPLDSTSYGEDFYKESTD